MPVMLPFSDRSEAGRSLALELVRSGSPSNCLVLALPRGGVPVAFEIARHLGYPLDVLFVAKVGLPSQPELALAAVASGGGQFIDSELAGALDLSANLLQDLVEQKARQLQIQEAAFRARHPAIPLSGRSVVLVDDGAATGSTMLAAVRSARQQDAAEIIVAVPVASREAASQFRRVADKVVCGACPHRFMSVSQWYKSFPQVSDETVQQMLNAGKASCATTALS